MGSHSSFKKIIVNVELLTNHWFVIEQVRIVDILQLVKEVKLILIF